VQWSPSAPTSGPRATGPPSEPRRRAARRRARSPRPVGPEEAARLTREGALSSTSAPPPSAPSSVRSRGAVIERNNLEWRLDRPARPPPRRHRRTRAAGCGALPGGYASSLAAGLTAGPRLMNATDLDGGFAAWKRAGLPVTDPPAERRARAGSARAAPTTGLLRVKLPAEPSNGAAPKEKMPVGRHSQLAPDAVGHHGDNRPVERQPPGQARKRGVAVGEDTAIGGGSQYPSPLGIAGHPHHGGQGLLSAIYEISFRYRTSVNDKVSRGRPARRLGRQQAINSAPRRGPSSTCYSRLNVPSVHRQPSQRPQPVQIRSRNRARCLPPRMPARHLNPPNSDLPDDSTLPIWASNERFPRRGPPFMS